METNPLFQFNLRDLYRVLFRHKRRCAIFAAVVGLLVIAVVAVTPRKYVSEAQLLVNVGLESLNTDPTTNGTPSVSLQVAREEEMKSILDLLRSHTIAAEVVNELGPQFVLQSAPKDQASDESWLGSLKKTLKGALGSVEVSDHERAVQKIRKLVSVSSTAKSNVIQVVAEAESSELAQRVVQAYVRVGRQKHSNAHQAENSTEFLAAKLIAARAVSSRASKELRDFKNTMGVASIDERKKTLESQIQQLQTNVVNAQSDLASFHDKIEQQLQRVSNLPSGVLDDSSTSVSTQSLDTMRAELFELRVRTQGLASRLTPSHPQYRGAMQQVEKAERDLEIEELRYSYSNVARLNARVTAFNHELAAKRDQLHRLNEDEVELKSLQSEADLLAKRYERYNADLANAKIIEDRRSHEITNINVFQPASKIEMPVSPNRKLLAALGAAAALFGSVALAFGSEMLDSTLKTPEDIESQLELPVLESIPNAPEFFTHHS